MATGNFFGGQFFGGGFFGSSQGTVVPVGGHGAEQFSDDPYSEPRRVTIDGLPYTVRSKAEYVALLARARRRADDAIERAREAARAKLEAKRQADGVLVRPVASVLDPAEIEEIRWLLALAVPQAQRIREELIPVEILLLAAED